MEVRGASSSWLTRPRNSALCRPSSRRGGRSWTVTTTDSGTPSSDRMGVALMMALTRRPSGTCISISSARTVSPEPSAAARGYSLRETSRPSARRKVNPSSSCSGLWPGSLSPAAIRSAARLTRVGIPVPASKTTTPTGEVLTRVSRSARARCSSRWRRALAMTRAAWAANMARVSSSSWLNSRPSASWAR